MVIAHLQCEGFDASGIISSACGGSGADVPQQRPELWRRSGERSTPGRGGAEAGGSEEEDEGDDEDGGSVGGGPSTPGVGAVTAAAAAATAAASESLRLHLGELAAMPHRGYDLGLLLTSFLHRQDPIEDSSLSPLFSDVYTAKRPCVHLG